MNGINYTGKGDSMGTIVSLNVNNLCIDWGKNYFYSAHSWLYDDKKFEKKYDDFDYSEGSLAMSDNLENIKFRLDNLGYSLEETEGKFNKTLTSWKRTHDCVLNFEILKSIIQDIDLEVLSDSYFFNNREQVVIESFYDWLAINVENNNEYINLKEKYVNSLANEDEYFDDLKDFFDLKMDRYVILRLLCENKKNLEYELNWFCYDIVESGWATIEDINYFDDKSFIIEHNKIYGKLQKYAVNKDCIKGSIKAMDEWLFMKDITVRVEYIKEDFQGNISNCSYTLPTFIRNVIHHPENTNNTFTDSDLMSSVNLMLSVIKSNELIL